MSIFNWHFDCLSLQYVLCRYSSVSGFSNTTSWLFIIMVYPPVFILLNCPTYIYEMPYLFVLPNLHIIEVYIVSISPARSLSLEVTILSLRPEWISSCSLYTIQDRRKPCKNRYPLVFRVAAVRLQDHGVLVIFSLSHFIASKSSLKIFSKNSVHNALKPAPVKDIIPSLDRGMDTASQAE